SYLDLAPTLRERVADIDYVDLRFDDRIYVRPASAPATVRRGRPEDPETRKKERSRSRLPWEFPVARRERHLISVHAGRSQGAAVAGPMLHRGARIPRHCA